MKLAQVYRALLRLYPREYRARFSAEMAAVFEAAAKERRLSAEGAARFSQSAFPDELAEAEQRVVLLIHRMTRAIADHDFPGARSYSHQGREARATLRRLREEHGIGGGESA